MRKTLEILPLVEYVNNQLARTDEYADQKFKAGICTMIERILMDANRYNGFGYLNGGQPHNEYNRYYYV
jgi:hypothetical protein